MSGPSLDANEIFMPPTEPCGVQAWSHYSIEFLVRRQFIVVFNVLIAFREQVFEIIALSYGPRKESEKVRILAFNGESSKFFFFLLQGYRKK